MKVLYIPGFGHNRKGMNTVKLFPSICKLKLDVDYFIWGQSRSLNMLNILSYYNSEQKLARSNIVHKLLFEKLEDCKPDILIAHSLGCDLLLSAICDDISRVKFIKKIVLCQSDMEPTLLARFAKKLEIYSSKMEIVHTYSAFDDLLWMTSFVNLSVRSGLINTNYLNIKSEKIDLLKGKPWFHNTPLVSDTLLKYFI